jgi:tRNA threonylcarbamoyladenosine biosynthesis protein TsaB
VRRVTLLAVDTSSAYASVAVFDGKAVVAEETWHARRRHDDHLFPAIERVLALAGVTRTDVKRVGVAIGPGSFTGVRVGIAAVQGIARGADVPVAGVPTCDAVAHPFASLARRVCVLIDAGRGEHYFAMYRTRRGRWERTSDIEIGSLAQIARAVAMDTVFAGDVDATTAAQLEELLGRRAVVPPASALVRRAGHLAEVAWARLDAGDAAHPDSLEPIYVRPPAIRGRGGEILAPEAAPGPAVRVGS